MASLLARIRRGRAAPPLPAPAPAPPPAPYAPARRRGRTQEEIAAELPDDDLREDLGESLDLYVLGSKPRCEEAEYLELLRDAIDRMEDER
ncbi:hypothetical protein [Streptomyces sp. Z26]|uniref:hypothetical protein n=1 Tax=Streptomyces TaxID=1883 RepID=UPI000EF15AF2|nr:hypothetical protein [Streptomyces sp. Z26]RLL68469.1 hypothetical protein D7M15_18315 [Streptomyces sp. Z26]